MKHHPRGIPSMPGSGGPKEAGKIVAAGGWDNPVVDAAPASEVDT